MSPISENLTLVKQIESVIKNVYTNQHISNEVRTDSLIFCNYIVNAPHNHEH